VQTLVLGAALSLLLLGTAVAIIRLTDERSLTSALVGVYLAAWAELVLVSEALSFIGQLNRAGLLIAETALAAVAVAAVLLRGSPPLRWSIKIPSPRNSPILAALGAVVGLSFLYQAVLGLTLPPNNWDSMVYHLTRVAYWRQEERLAYIAHPSNQVLNVYPVNGELGILFSFFVSGTDRLAAAPQLLASLALVVAVYGIARRLQFEKRAAAFAALVTATLPQVALQATTTQNDLVTAAFIAAAVYFLLGTTRFDTGLAVAAIGLAVGTKVIVLLAIPFGLVIVARCHGRHWRRLAVYGFPAIGLLGSERYVENVIRGGDPIGHPIERAADAATGVRQSLVDGAHLLYRFLELPGFVPAYAFATSATVVAAVAAWLVLRHETLGRRTGGLLLGLAPLWLILPLGLAARRLFAPDWPTGRPHEVLFNFRANEDLALFGPLGPLALVPLAVWALAISFRRRAFSTQAALALALPAFIATYFLILRYTPFVGRFLLFPIAATAPLLAHLYRSRATRVPLAAIAIVTLVLVDVFNEAKPLRSHSEWIWNRSRADSQALMRPAMRPVLEGLAVVPEDATIGVSVRNDDWVYPAFGPTLGRRVVFLPREHPLDTARHLRIDWVLIAGHPQAARGWTIASLGKIGLGLATARPGETS
jgi:hypothetical protein